MPDVRKQIEEVFAWWSGLVFRRRWLFIVSMCIFAVVFAIRIPNLEIETSTEEYLFDDDPAKVAYDAFREQFGRDQPLMVLAESSSPEGVFDFEFLQRLVALHKDLEDSVLHLADVTSLYNVRAVRGDGDELIVDDLLEEMPDDAASLAKLKAHVLASSVYQSSVISPDGGLALVVVKANAYSKAYAPIDDLDLSGFGEEGIDSTSSEGRDGEKPKLLTGAENTEFSESVIAVVERHKDSDFQLHLTGQPLITYAMTRLMEEDFPRIFGAALATISLIMVALFRRLSPVLLAALIVVVSLATTMGFSEWVGIPVGLPTQVLPTFMLAVGVGYAVHLMTIFFRAFNELGDRQAALEVALRHTGLPILMTAVTTAAGLLSFSVAEMGQVVDLGVLGAVGVAVTLVFSMTLLPALLVTLPIQGQPGVGLEGGNWFLTACARVSVRHPKTLVAAALLLALGSIALIPSLEISANPIEYFPQGHWLREATHLADERNGGMQSLEILIDTGRENGLHEPEVLAQFESLERLIETLRSEGEDVGQTQSILDVVRETHQALNENRSEFYRLPTEKRLIAQELLLFENTGSDDLEELVDPQFIKARMSVLTSWEDGVEKERFIERVRDRLLASMGDLAEVQLTGAVVLIARVSAATSASLVNSYSLALVLITPLMILLIGSLRAGLVSMVPNLVPILATLGLLVILDMKFDMFMLLGGCIAIGLAVDDSIHFITGFRRYLAETGDPVVAVERTMETTGRALLFTSIVLVAGFGVLSLSSMANLANLGLMTSWAIALAFVLDVTVTPALLVLTHRK